MGTPIKFLELTLQNFMSYGNNVTTINLDFKEPILIIGKNHDAAVNGQLDSNGAGKSAILDAIAFVLYDKTISNKEKTSLINNINKKNLEVTLTFQKDGIKYKIVRMRKTKTKADVQLLVQGNDGQYKDKTPDSIANTNAEIERIIGLPFDVFSRIIVFSATFQPFLDLPSRHASKASQTSIMEELFGYTELTEKAENLKAKIKGVKTEFAHLEELQQQISNEISRNKSQIEDVKERLENWKINQKQRISDTEDEISKLSKVNVRREIEYLETLERAKKSLENLISEKRVLDAERKTLQAKIDTVEEKKEKIDSLREKVKLVEEKVDFEKEEQLLDILDKLQEKCDKLTQAKQEKRKEKASITDKIKDIDDQVKHLSDDECPYCGQEYKDAIEKMKELSSEKLALQDKLEELASFIDECDKKLREHTSNQEKAKKKSSTKGSRSDLNRMQAQYENQKTQLESYIEEQIDASVYEELSEKESKIESLVEDINSKEKQVNKMVAEANYSSSSELERISARLEAAKAKLEDLHKEENPHTATYDKMKEALAKLQAEDDKSDKLNELEDTLAHQEFLLKLLTKKDSFVRKNLLDRSLPFLNKRLMGYLEKLGLPHRVEFQPDMSAKISQFGTELDFGSLSSGQKARVNLALAFAFRDVLQARHGKISFCMLDECLDTGLGNLGVQMAAKMIKQIATEDNMSMFIISHRDEISSMFNNQLVVELKNGFSNVATT